MRRPLLGAALLLGVLVATSQQGSTAGNDMPAATTLDYGRTTVEGGTLLQISYGYDSTGRATGMVADLKGNLISNVLGLKTVTASYDGGGPLVCAAGVFALLGDYTRYSCTGLAPRKGIPSVTIRVS